MLDQEAVNDLIRLADSNEGARPGILRILKSAGKRDRKTAKVKTDRECMKRYQTAEGDFKGGKGEAFKKCVEAFTKCSNAKSPEGLCAYIGRETGKIGSKRLITAEEKDAAWEDAFKVASDLGETNRVSALFANIVLEQQLPSYGDLLAIDEVRHLCPSCADKMASRGLKKIAYHVLVNSSDYLG